MTGYPQRPKQTDLIGGFTVFSQRIRGSQGQTRLPPLQHGLGDLGRDFSGSALRRAFEQGFGQTILGQFFCFCNGQLGYRFRCRTKQPTKQSRTKQKAGFNDVKCSLGNCCRRSLPGLNINRLASFLLFSSLALNVPTILLHKAWQGDTDQTTNRATKGRTNTGSKRSSRHRTKPCTSET